MAFGLLFVRTSLCQNPSAPFYFHPSGIPGTISDVEGLPLPPLARLPRKFSSNDIDLQKMAAWSLRYLNRCPRPALHYEPVFFVRPMHVPPVPEGHDSIVPGDTDVRMDWEYPNMRAILAEAE